MTLFSFASFTPTDGWTALLLAIPSPFCYSLVLYYHFSFPPITRGTSEACSHDAWIQWGKRPLLLTLSNFFFFFFFYFTFLSASIQAANGFMALFLSLHFSRALPYRADFFFWAKRVILFFFSAICSCLGGSIHFQFLFVDHAYVRLSHFCIFHFDF